jgi:hypothetical protein
MPFHDLILDGVTSMSNVSEDEAKYYRRLSDVILSRERFCGLGSTQQKVNYSPRSISVSERAARMRHLVVFTMVFQEVLT